jgi:hypothetical protein
MNDKPVTSPAEASREGLAELEEHTHPHHQTTAHTPPPSKHQTPAVGPEPTPGHRAGPFPHQK